MKHKMRLIPIVVVLVSVCAVESMAGGEKATGKWADRQRMLFDRVNLADAWAITKGDPDTLIGVLDNGFDFFHPDLEGQLLPGYYYAGGYHNEIYENIAHGTMVAGIMVAKDDGQGVVGLAPRCRVVTASQGAITHTLLQLQKRYFKENPGATMADFQAEMEKHADEMERFGLDWVSYQVGGAAEAIRYLVGRGVNVINLSSFLVKRLCPDARVWEKLEEAFAYAAAKDVVIVLAAGNNAEDWDDYPGDERYVIVVGATLSDDSRWEQQIDMLGMKMKQGSNFGRRLSVMAPAQDIAVCVPHEMRMYSSANGPLGTSWVPFMGIYQITPNGATSSAAPVVSALVALVRTARPDLDAESVVRIIQKGCDDIGDPGHDIHTGHGRVNFGKTLEAALAWPKNAAETYSEEGD